MDRILGVTDAALGLPSADTSRISRVSGTTVLRRSKDSSSVAEGRIDGGFVDLAATQRRNVRVVFRRTGRRPPRSEFSASARTCIVVKDARSTWLRPSHVNVGDSATMRISPLTSTGVKSVTCVPRPRAVCRASAGNGATVIPGFRVATFSSGPYVVNFLEEKLKAVFPKSSMITVPQKFQDLIRRKTFYSRRVWIRQVLR